MARRLAVDLAERGMALTTDHAERNRYLDRRTGEVLMVPVDRLGDADARPFEERIDAGLDAGRLLPIEPLGSSVEHGRMAEFAPSVTDAQLCERLYLLLAGRGAFQRSKLTLSDHPAERARWFAVRDARLDAAAREWLAMHGIEALRARAGGTMSTRSSQGSSGERRNGPA